MHGGNAPCSVGNWLVAAGYIGDDGRDPPNMVSVGLLGPFCSGRVGRGDRCHPIGPTMLSWAGLGRLGGVRVGTFTRYGGA